MLLGPTDVTVIFGIRGSGKSTLSRKLSSAYPRVVVIDPLGEWRSREATGRAHDFASFSAAYRAVDGLPSWRLVYEPNPSLSLEAQEAEFDATLRLLYLDGRERQTGVCLVIEEVHLIAPISSMHHWFRQIVFTGRHAELAIIAGTQRPASVNKALVSQASHVFAGQLFESRDVRYLQETCSEAMARHTPHLQKLQFIGFTPGQELEQVTLTDADFR
ncbi:MAG: hypothetical protein AB7F66_17665 [Bacteriovoracia bacterium]